MSGLKREREDDGGDTDQADGQANKKIKLGDVEDIKFEEGMEGRAVGRVRKKSAKVLEMEEFEEAEKKQYKKGTPDSSKKTNVLLNAKKVKVKPEEGEVQEMPNIPDSTTPPPKKQNKSSVIKLLLSSPAVPTTPSVSTKAVTKSKTGEANTAESDGKGVTASTKKAIKSKVKVKDMTSPTATSVNVPVKIETVSDTSMLSPTLATFASPTDISSQLQDKKDSSLKMKLLLSPKEEPTSAELIAPSMQVVKSVKKAKKKKEGSVNEPTSTSKSPSEAMPNLAALVNAANTPITADAKKKTGSKKKKKTAEEYEFETLSEAVDPLDADEEPQLVIANTGVETPSSPAKKPAKKPGNGTGKVKKKSKTESSDETPTDTTPPEGDIAALSAKVFSKKKKVVSESKPTKMKKKKRPPTAYTLWCNAHRTEVLKENPKMDFAQMSRRLGVIWQGLSKKEKMSWKRKAKKLAGKGSTLISTGKMKPPPATQPSMVLSTSLPTPTTPVTVGKKQPVDEHQHLLIPKGLGTDPVDVAAHLKLMGESLSIIGMRLQETKGHMAVQGGLSVLLDSLICSCGPLLCLTQQISELNGCDRTLHAKTLDNIAYIMPGL